MDHVLGAMFRSGRVKAAAALCVAIAALSGNAWAEPAYTRVVHQKSTISVNDEAGDLLVVDGRVEIQGVVRGHIYAVDAEVYVRSTAVVLKSMTLNRGALHLEEGAVLPPTIDLVQTKFYGPHGETVSQDKPLLLGGATMVELLPTKLSTASISLMKSVLPFERIQPPLGTEVKHLREWHPGLGMMLKKFVENENEMVVGGIARLTFVSDKVRGSFQRGYRGKRGSVLFSGIHLVDEEAARSLWDEVHRVGPKAKVSLSVESGLGDGQHWFFRRHTRYCMMWQVGNWFYSVETRLNAEKPSIFQQKQFNEQVLRSLRSQQPSEKSLSSQGAKP